MFDEDTKSHNTEVVHYIQLKNQRNQVFYDKLTFIYITADGLSLMSWANRQPEQYRNARQAS